MLRESLPNYDARIKIEQVLKIYHLAQNINFTCLKYLRSLVAYFIIRNNRLTMICSSLFIKIPVNLYIA